MEDAGTALSGNRDVCMLGGGNPARIPTVQSAFRNAMHALLEDGNRFDLLIGDYDGPQGNTVFIEAVADLLNQQYGWAVSPKNIALTNGSQSSFFVLFNMFAGLFKDGNRRRILLPLVPEYIGYTEMGLGTQMFDTCRPTMTLQGDHEFKYHIDFEKLTVSPGHGAICVSRPTNPTGNVLTDQEIALLQALALEHGLPFIIDGAYGTPFPNIIFSKAAPVWDQNIILCLSLSKLGLAGVRTGIVIANENVIQSITGSNAVLSLTPGSFGPGLVTRMMQDGSILDIANKLIRPYYQERARTTLDWLKSALGDYPFHIHSPEGAFFLWLWFPNLPISSEMLYQRLKQRDVLVIAGEHFFPGLTEDWPHSRECIRVSYALNPDVVQRGISILAEEIKAAYAPGARSGHSR